MEYWLYYFVYVLLVITYHHYSMRIKGHYFKMNVLKRASAWQSINSNNTIIGTMNKIYILYLFL